MKELIINLFQTTREITEVLSTNDATIVGVLIAVCLALGGAVIYLYKSVQTLNKDFTEKIQAINKDFILELKENQTILIEMTKKYHEFTNNVMQLKK
jgi:uncharacterized protein HemX